MEDSNNEQQYSEEDTEVQLGTTIIALIYGENNGVLLGCDTRVSQNREGEIRLVQSRVKISKIIHKIYLCGSGIARIFDNVINLSRNRFRNKSGDCDVRDVANFVKRSISRIEDADKCAFIIAGLDMGLEEGDPDAPEIFLVKSDIDILRKNNVTIGSSKETTGPYLDDNWKSDLTRQEAEDVLREALKSGIESDVCSGYPVCLVRIDSSGVHMRYENEKGEKVDGGNIQVF